MEIHLQPALDCEAHPPFACAMARQARHKSRISFLRAQLEPFLQLRLDHRPCKIKSREFPTRPAIGGGGLKSHASHHCPSLHWPKAGTKIYSHLADGIIARRHTRRVDAQVMSRCAFTTTAWRKSRSTRQPTSLPSASRPIRRNVLIRLLRNFANAVCPWSWADSMPHFVLTKSLNTPKRSSAVKRNCSGRG